MEGGQEDVNCRAKDAYSSEYEPTDMSNESELENVEELGESEPDCSEMEVVSSTESTLTELGSHMAMGMPLDQD